MTDEDAPTCWIIAGPNGAGKTTFALEYLPQVANCRRFFSQAVNLTQCFMNIGSAPELIFVQ